MIFICRRANVQWMNMNFSLPANYLGLSLLVEVARNPEQAQEHKPLPLWGWLAMPMGLLSGGRTQLPWPTFSQKAEQAGIFLMKQPCQEELPTNTKPQASKCSACQHPTATPFQGQCCLQLLHKETFHLAACPCFSLQPWAPRRCQPGASCDLVPATPMPMSSSAPMMTGTHCHRLPTLRLSPTPSRPRPSTPRCILKRLVLK